MEATESRLTELIARIEDIDLQAITGARERQDRLTKPRGSLGRLEQIAVQLAGIRGDPLPRITEKVIITMAGDHGVVAEGVSLYPQAVTAQMVHNFLAGGAGVNVLARHVGARVVVADLGVAAQLSGPSTASPSCRFLGKKVRWGTDNMRRGPAMSREEALACLQAGVEVLEEAGRGADIVGIGEMGIGNTTSASAICALLTASPVTEVTGRGTGLDDEALRHKVEVIELALAVNRPNPADAIDVLAKVGGCEIGGMAGAMLAAAAHRLPVVLDGFICGAAALIACALAPRLRGYLIASHQSVEVGHRRLLRHLGLTPILKLDLHLGEGTGAALGIFMAEAAARILNEMATFAEAGVSSKEN